MKSDNIAQSKDTFKSIILSHFLFVNVMRSRCDNAITKSTVFEISNGLKKETQQLFTLRRGKKTRTTSTKMGNTMGKRVLKKKMSGKMESKTPLTCTCSILFA